MERFWPRVEVWLSEALSYGEGLYSIQHYKRCCLSRDMQLWIAWDETQGKIVAAAVTNIQQHELKKILAIPLIGGSDWKDWYWMHREIGEGARRLHGCVEIHGYARDGWLKPCLKDGWVKRYNMITKAL